MTSSFRFSPRPNRAHEIAWREWGAAAFAEAEATGRPVLLNLAAVWCQWSHEMDETTFSDSAVISLLNGTVIPIRVDADRYPHVQDRYIAGGWPTNAFLTSTGEVLWSGTYTDAAKLEEVANGVIAAWSQRRDEFQQEIERRRQALASARTRHATMGLVRREAADDVVAATREAFDPRNGGFGDAPKFPSGDAIEMLYTLAAHGESDAQLLADQTLDGMLAGDLFDRASGGFFRYATSADWTAPRFEKLLEINAIQLEAYALGACVRARPDWTEVARKTVTWVDDTLALPNGLWAGSQFADDAYFALSGEARAHAQQPPVDQTLYTSWNAMWIAALSGAGARLNERSWTERASYALEELVRTMQSADGLMYHFRIGDGAPALDYLFADTLETARAALIHFQTTGEARWLELARNFAHAMEKHYWAEDGGFWDRTKEHDEIGALRYRERPFELNARAARLLLDLSLVTGVRGFRGLAERTLALLSPQAGRFGAAGAMFAMAVEEFFSPPAFLAVVGPTDATDALRRAALALPLAARRVWTLPEGGRIGTQALPASPAPALYACGRQGRSAPILDETALAHDIPTLV